MIYKENLKKLRENKELNQKDLLNILNLSASQYSHYENEMELMPIKHLNTICNYFNVSFDYIFNFNNTVNYNNNFKDINPLKSGKRLKEIRKENNLTQKRLAQILNVANGTIANYEVGSYIIATPFLYEICNKYRISADYLLGKIDSPKYLK